MGKRKTRDTNESKILLPHQPPSERPSIPRVKPVIHFRAGGVVAVSIEMAITYKRKDDQRKKKGLEPKIDRIEGLD